ncbi:PfkB family carbohydrate kinase [Actinomycetospora sp. CA-053990]|uniref:PfkB family carbohydrate kinase n=1 Tax=Actinomycetospora sp. CA-053990 TaxID=3239891 RepID=UPI003D94906D
MRERRRVRRPRRSRRPRGRRGRRDHPRRRGAELRRRGRVVAHVASPPVDAVDGTAAGDAFTAALAIALATGVDDESALTRACRAGALTATRPGAQPSLPTFEEIDVPWPR